MMKRILRFADSVLTVKHLLWSIPGILTIHNIEEALTMPQWVVSNLALVQGSLPFASQLHFERAQLYVSLGLATAVPLCVTLLCAGGNKKSPRLFILLLLQAVIFLNVFIPHILASIIFLRYNPGVVTAVCLNLPFSLYVFRRAVREEYLERRTLVSLFLLALVLYPLIAWANHYAGEWIARAF